ncbi:MAG: ABC transporter ATP-binding protein [Gammaproteobacteria bacterium]|nr:ABC transporter ATP-binding protein [Gammaproteobacteria bacterium]MBU1732539.1 ABC transporter ATP-binding protein [Gammaproteobacteria bacterium]MBU1893402.1 ABC transporter ATP-binding protein [Gammaproteobacteria bacterium]
MSDIAIQASGLGRAFGEMWAVRGLDLEVRRGEIFGLVGPDGAGKTTTMRMLTGILAASEGTATVAGYSIQGGEEQIKSRISYMSQRFGLYGDLTVEENLRFYADLYEVPRRERETLEERLLGFSNLTPFRKRLARNLSGGMKQKLGLACALIHKPEILFLDEPTNGVDPVSRRDFWRILYAMLKEGVTIFVSTAYLDEAERCTRVGLMHRGSLIQCDTPQKLKEGIPGLLLELETERPRVAREALAGQLGWNRISLFGGKLHLYAGDEAEAEQARTVLQEAGIAVLAEKTITPTLEDVFIYQVSQEQEEEA